MAQELEVFENNGNDIAIDPDNLFWAAMPRERERGKLIPSEVLSLYRKVKEKLDSEMRDFRFSANLSAVYIDPTDKCNAGCPYCYISSKFRRSGVTMTQDELNLVLDKIKDYFLKAKKKAVIIFHASEPLLAKEIIFTAIRKYHKIFKFGLQTNCLLMEKKDVDFLKEYQVGVGISLDSHLRRTNNRLRPALSGGGNFSAALNTMRWFDGYAGLNVIATVNKFNLKDLPGLVKFVHAQRVPCLLLNPMRFTQKTSHSLKPDQKMMAQYFIQAVETAITLSQDSPHKIIIGNFTNIILGIIAPMARRMMCDISPCGGGRCFLTITAAGYIIPCGEFKFMGLENFSGGNIFKGGSIKEAMVSKAFQEVRERFVEKIPECASCSVRNICGAPCPAEMHSLGDRYKKSVFCEFYQEIIRYAFKLIAQGELKSLLRKEGFEGLEYAYQM